VESIQGLQRIRHEHSGPDQGILRALRPSCADPSGALAGASAPSLSHCSCECGGLGACGALLMTPEEIGAWTEEVRAASNGAFQLNLWIPDPSPVRDPGHEARVARFLATWGPVSDSACRRTPHAGLQCTVQGSTRCTCPIVSSVMGSTADFVATLKSRGIAWFANVSTVQRRGPAAAAGADVVIAQGMEAGGHRGVFDASRPNSDGGVGCSSPRRG